MGWAWALIFNLPNWTQMLNVFDWHNLSILNTLCSTGTPWVWRTSRLQRTSGTAKTHHHGCSLAATITSWCGTTVKRCWWRRHCSCGDSECYWTMTTTPSPSTMPWTHSTCTPSTSPSCFLLPLPLWSRINHWWSCLACLCPTLWTALSSRTAAAGSKSLHMVWLWRAATETLTQTVPERSRSFVSRANGLILSTLLPHIYFGPTTGSHCSWCG